MSESESDLKRHEQDREAAYRRGAHQAIAWCRRWVGRCATLEEAKSYLEAAQADARTRRNSHGKQDYMLDLINLELFPDKTQKPPPT